MASSKITKIVKNYSADFDRRREGLPEIISTVNGHADDIDGLDTRVTALENTNPEIPAHTSADAGKFLGVDSQGELEFDYAPDDELPEYGIADAGKVLTVENDGTLGFVTPEAGGLSEDVIADEFDQTATVIPGTVAAAGDVYEYLGYYYKAKRNTSGAWNASDWQLLTERTVESWGVFINSNEYIDISGDLCFNLGNPTSINAPVTVASATAAGLTNLDPDEYSAGSTTYHSYNVGDYVMYDGKLYKCIDDTTGEQWYAGCWQETQVTDEFGGSSGESIPAHTAADEGRVLTVDNTNQLIWAAIPASGATFPSPNTTQPKLRIGTTTDGAPVYVKRMVFQYGAPEVITCETGYEFLGIIAINSFVMGGNGVYHAYDQTAGMSQFDINITNSGATINVQPTTAINHFTVYADLIWAETESM